MPSAPTLTFNAILSPDDLPQLGSRETPSLDFKTQAPFKDATKLNTFEAAKDVAAMASVYGGVLVIGAAEDTQTGTLVHYKCMSPDDAQRVVKQYEEAVRDRCQPVPLIDARALPHPNGSGQVVVVNVLPVLDQPVGVRVRGDKEDGFGGAAYVFPIRTNTHAVFLEPEHLAMFMNAAIRRIVILLGRIPADKRESVGFHWEGFRESTATAAPVVTTTMKLNSVDIEANVAVVEYSGAQFSVPLEDVEAVWSPSGGTWAIRVAGYFNLNPPYRYTTRTR